MKIFLSTSYNQKNQIEHLYKVLNLNFESFKLIVVESGEERYDNISKINRNFKIIYTDSNSFWGKSIAIGLNYIYSNKLDLKSDLIILNCDVVLNDWKVLNTFNELKTFYTVQNQVVARSGYNIINWYIAIHDFPYNGYLFSDTKKKYVDAVPTRLICIPNYLINNIVGIIPNYKRLPHYASDYEFTYRIRTTLDKKWLIDNSTFIIEDQSTTGFKTASGCLTNRLKLLISKKSIFNIKDRFWYSYLISKKQTLGERICYVCFSMGKLFIQLFKIKS